MSRRTHFLFLAIIIAAALLSLNLILFGDNTRAEVPPQTPPDTPVMEYLQTISSTHSLSGQHNREPNSNPMSWTNMMSC